MEIDKVIFKRAKCRTAQMLEVRLAVSPEGDFNVSGQLQIIKEPLDCQYTLVQIGHCNLSKKPTAERCNPKWRINRNNHVVSKSGFDAKIQEKAKRQ